jgi:hypothetical protein
MEGKIYYLSSLESETFKPTRKCIFLNKLHFDTGKECVIAEIDPPVPGQHFGTSEDIKHVIFTNRYEGDTLFPVNEYPCFVFITKPLFDNIFKAQVITKDDLQILAWGELYRTALDAENHVFD